MSRRENNNASSPTDRKERDQEREGETEEIEEIDSSRYFIPLVALITYRKIRYISTLYYYIVYGIISIGWIDI